jgi:hypothetical protein
VGGVTRVVGGVTLVPSTAQMPTYDLTAWTSTQLPFLPQTLCGWLLPGPRISVSAGAPRPTAICAAVVPLP